MTGSFIKLMRSGIVIFALFFLGTCQEDYTPKPKGYFRINLPPKTYKSFQSDCNFHFEIPAYSVVLPHPTPPNELCWYDIFFPRFNAKLYLSYKNLNGSVDQLMEESRKLAYKHTIKADAIEENYIDFPDGGKIGVLYDIEGNAASPLQFFISDSTSHFLRGSLYFNNNPNADSVAPVLNFIRQDVAHLIETLEWE